MVRIVVLLSVTVFLSACGLKGPLYLPEKSKPAVVTQSASSQSVEDGKAQSSQSSSSSSSSQSSTP